MWGKKKKKEKDQARAEANHTVQRRSTFSASSSSTSTTTTAFYSSSETVRRSNLSTQIQNRESSANANPLPSTSSAFSFLDSNFSIDARPFQPTTITPNYQSSFQRNRLYNSARPTFNSPPISTSISSSRATIGANSWSRPLISGSTLTTRTTALPPTEQPTTKNASALESYDTNGKNRGNVLIINNINFIDNNEERKGAEIDEEQVVKLFRDMGFTPVRKRDLKLSQMKNEIKAFRKSKDLAKGDISVVIIMSHGTNKDKNNIPVSGSFTQIVSADGQLLDTEEVVAEFSATNCPGMKGKPKIFIFQCCRGEEQELQADCLLRRTNKKEVIKEHADILIAFSTLPNFYSLRDTKKGSWYIQCICDVFRKYAKDHHVEDLLKLVDKEMSNMDKRSGTSVNGRLVQTTTYESRGFNKQCFLNPRW